MLAAVLASTFGALFGGGIIFAIALGTVVYRIRTGRWPPMHGGI